MGRPRRGGYLERSFAHIHETGRMAAHASAPSLQPLKALGDNARFQRRFDHASADWRWNGLAVSKGRHDASGHRAQSDSCPTATNDPVGLVAKCWRAVTTL